MDTTSTCRYRHNTCSLHIPASCTFITRGYLTVDRRSVINNTVSSEGRRTRAAAVRNLKQVFNWEKKNKNSEAHVRGTEYYFLIYIRKCFLR